MSILLQGRTAPNHRCLLDAKTRVASSARRYETVARACAIPNQAETLKFATNRRVVATVAANALRDMNPGLSHEELVTRETQWVKNLVARTSALVAESSCSSQQVQKLLELYRLQAKMDFSGAH